MDQLQDPAFLIFAFFSPLLIAVLKQAGFSRQVNALIAQAAYVVVGIGAVLLSGETISLDTLGQAAITATVVGSAAYNLLWSNLGANEEGEGSIDQRITEATSVVK